MRQYMLPSEVVSPELSPALSSSQLCARIIRKAYVLQPADIDAQGNALILMPPSINGPAFVTTPGATTFPNPASIFSAEATNIGPNSDGYLTGAFHLKDFQGTNECIVQTQAVTLGGVTRMSTDMNFPGGTPVHYTVTAKTKDTGFVVKFFSSDGANWYGGGGSPSPPVTYGTPVSNTFTLGASSRYLAIRLEKADGSAHDAPCLVDIAMKVGDQTHAPFVNISGTTVSLFSKFSKVVIDEKISSGRLCSMSMLVSNTSSALNKQGEIYIGRLQPEVLHTSVAELAAHIVAQPANRRYEGPAEFGGYAWWMPDNLALQDPSELSQFNAACKQQEILFCYLRGLVPAQSTVNIEFTWYVEFFTTNQLFEKKNTPPYGDWADVLHVLSTAPAATCNPEHFETFKKIIHKAAETGKGIYEHYQKHKVLYDTALAALLAL